MSRISPKPVINQMVRAWRVQPGMTFAVVEDIEGNTWIVESCPAGTHFWTVAQAAELNPGLRTRRALQEAILVGRERAELNRIPSLPVYDAELEAAVSSAPQPRPAPRRRVAVNDRALVGV
jgi:hypothetical protein